MSKLIEKEIISRIKRWEKQVDEEYGKKTTDEILRLMND